MSKSGVVSRQHVGALLISDGERELTVNTRRYTLGLIGKRKGPICDKGVELVVQAFFLLNAQLPAVGVFHSDNLFVRFEFGCG